jgi:hypothetical protein
VYLITVLLDVQICCKFHTLPSDSMFISGVHNITPTSYNAYTIFGRFVALEIVRRGGNGRDLF